jgi:hypothetical protein
MKRLDGYTGFPNRVVHSQLEQLLVKKLSVHRGLLVGELLHPLCMEPQLSDVPG